MPITKKKFIELLNKDLSWEYTAMVQYIQHSGVITGAAYMSIKKEIILHASEELGHAVILADQISYLGGFPEIKVYEAKADPDNIKMLEQDLAGEEDAIRRYTERIAQAEELNLYHLAQNLRNILAMEQEHAMDLQEALGR
ncbi:MAG: ferritin-like domain-containing protein [Nitrospirae bacterium]|nr:ferritin-like domain-containing protein [Nitrospirota bacterium]MBI5696361.1 ferritin-like domain-containing protein [Nitrospirota bacterium]